MISNREGLPDFIVEIKDNVAIVPEEYANAVVHSKRNLIYMVRKLGYYLPEDHTKAMTCSFLLKTAQGTIWRIKTSDVKPYVTLFLTWSCVDLLAYIKEVLLKDEIVGFDLDKMPDKRYMLNIIHTINPGHEMFVGCNKTIR
jgi:hypothetical protein